MKADSYLVIVYPQDTSAAALGALGTGLASSLQAACGAMPVFVRPNMTALCLLVKGEVQAITQAVDTVTDAYSKWLVVKVGTPFAAHGLSTASQWLGRQG